MKAIILKVSDLGEKDRLVTLLTPGRGKMNVVARGARKPHSRLMGVVLPFQYVDLLLWRGRSLDGISQGEVLESFPLLREDLQRMSWASLGCEFSERLTRDDDDHGFFQLLLAYQRLLLKASGPQLPLCASWLMLQGLIRTGYGPQLDQCMHCGRALNDASDSRNIVFDAAGGVLCPDCAQRSPVHPSGSRQTVSPAVLGCLRFLRHAAAASVLRMKLAADGRVLLHLLEHFVQWNLDVRLRTLDFMNSTRLAEEEG